MATGDENWLQANDFQRRLLGAVESIPGSIVAAIEEMKDDISGRLDSIDQRLASVDARLTSVDARLASVDARLDQLSKCRQRRLPPAPRDLWQAGKQTT